MATQRQSDSYYYARADAERLANIPHELTKFKSWVVWEERPPEKTGWKYRKVPLNPSTLQADRWTSPDNWRHRALAKQVFDENPQLRGIGFVFHKSDDDCAHAKDQENPYTFFDLDDVIDKKGKIAAWAQEFIDLVDSYTEVSPSGTGVKIIVRANLSARPKTLTFTDAKGTGREVECYDTLRFFAATGKRWPNTPSSVREWQSELDTLHPQEVNDDVESALVIDRDGDQYADSVDAIPDEKLVEKIRESSQAKLFNRLMAGITNGYAGRFSASGALCLILAYWTRANAQRIDRLYRSSKLFEVGGGSDWWDDRNYRGGISRAQYVIASACKKIAGKPMFTPPSSGMILNNGGAMKPILANAIKMLSTHAAWEGVLAYNELTLFTVKLKPTPWGTTGDWTDHDDTKLAEWFQQHDLFIDSSKKAGEAAQAVAQANRFHPVRNYLNRLKWDGTSRIDSWLSTYLGAPNTQYSKAVGGAGRFRRWREHWNPDARSITCPSCKAGRASRSLKH